MRESEQQCQTRQGVYTVHARVPDKQAHNLHPIEAISWRSMRRPEVISLTTSHCHAIAMGSASSIERGSADFSPTGAKGGKSVSRKSTKKGSVDQKPPRRR
jgi:hypothetical protein